MPKRKRKTRIRLEAMMDLGGSIRSTLSKGPDSMATDDDVRKFCEQTIEHLKQIIMKIDAQKMISQ